MEIYDRATKEGEEASWGYADREDAVEEMERAGVACEIEEAMQDAEGVLSGIKGEEG